MMTITEKVAYLKGMADGMRLDESANEGKLLKTIIDVLEDMALTISDVEDTVAEVSQQVDEIDDDLAAIEDEWYDDEDEDDDDDCDGVRYEVECPVCGDVISIDEDLLEEGAIDCPNCGENLEFDFDEDDECDCGCNCEHGENK